MLFSMNNILIPFEYTRIEYNSNYVIVEKYGDKAQIPISELSPNKPIELTSSPDYDEPYDPNPWDAKSELKHIRENGGDWIFD